MTRISELRKQKRELIADMKEAGIKRMSCMNRQDNQAFSCNRELQELTIAISKAQKKVADQSTAFRGCALSETFERIKQCVN